MTWLELRVECKYVLQVQAWRAALAHLHHRSHQLTSSGFSLMATLSSKCRCRKLPSYFFWECSVKLHVKCDRWCEWERYQWINIVLELCVFVFGCWVRTWRAKSPRTSKVVKPRRFHVSLIVMVHYRFEASFANANVLLRKVGLKRLLHSYSYSSHQSFFQPSGCCARFGVRIWCERDLLKVLQ